MSKIIVANLKMNLLAKDLGPYLKEVEKTTNENVIICPPSLYIPYFLNKKFKVGLQNCFYESKGAFTGEIAPEQAASLGVKYVIIGHSERRQNFGEGDLLIKRKVSAAIKANLKVILCIGETLAEREMLKTTEVLNRQLKNILLTLKPEHHEKIIVAYEPVWAIGSGKTPTTDEINETIKYIKELIKVKVLYGGSVDLENIEALNTTNCDGFLIGSAAVMPTNFTKIIAKINI